MEWKKNINTNLGITIILVFSALFVIIDFYVIGAYMDGYPFNELSGNTNSNTINNNNPVIEDKEVVEENNSESHYVISDDISYDSIYMDKIIFCWSKKISFNLR